MESLSSIIIFILFMMLPIFIIFLKIRTEKFQNSANIMPKISSNEDIKLNNSQENAEVSMSKLTTKDDFCIDGECLTEYDLRLIIDGKDAESNPNTTIGGYTDDIKQTIFIENTNDDKTIKSTFLDKHDLKNFSTMWPLGAIINFQGELDDIPEGWALCNGDNGTPDLRDRFVMGKDTETFNDVNQKCPNLCNSDNDGTSDDKYVDEPVFCKDKTFSDCTTSNNTTNSTLKSKSNGPCQPGHFDVTNGKYNWWACGKNCKGGQFFTDGVCNCACQPIAKATDPNIEGENEHTIKLEEMPDHTHVLFSNNGGFGTGDSVGINASTNKTLSTNYFNNKLDPAGENIPYDNRPPYYSLFYIMRTDAGSNLKSKIQHLVDYLKQKGDENIDILNILRSQIYTYGYKPNV
jgi:hypothetical protein